MAIFAIGDLHLSFQENKPMSIFGDNWEGYEEKIKESWIKQVTEKDTVLLPGDFSWSMYLENCIADFVYLQQLPGKKLLLKGNHDYWWSTINKMRKFIKENKFTSIDFLHNNSYFCDGYIIAGTRGWTQSLEEEDKKIVNREVIRLELSIKDGIEKYGSDKPIIVCMHYPPITSFNLQNNRESPFIKLMKKYDIKMCIYGHLHSTSIKEAIQGEIEGINLKLVSADSLNFEVTKII